MYLAGPWMIILLAEATQSTLSNNPGARQSGRLRENHFDMQQFS